MPEGIGDHRTRLVRRKQCDKRRYLAEIDLDLLRHLAPPVSLSTWSQVLSYQNHPTPHVRVTHIKEADLFSSHFLIPKEGFDQEWEETAGLPFPDRVMKVKQIFRVSYKTVLFRLIEKGIVDNSIWRRFNAIYEKRYRRKLSYKEEPFSEGAEPFGMDSIDFIGDRLSRLTPLHSGGRRTLPIIREVGDHAFSHGEKPRP